MSPTTTPADTDETTTTTDARRLLETYLRDHHAAAGAGVALARRCHQNNLGSEFEQELGGLVIEIERDAERLRTAMAALGVEPSRIKSMGARLGELVARLKANGRLFEYSPASRVLELEGLLAGITAKRQLWRSLSAAEQDALDRSELETLSSNADGQIALVDALPGRAAHIAFDPTAR